MIYATAQDYRERFLLPADGSADPPDLELGLKEASLLMDRTWQIQASLMIDEYESVTADNYKEATVEQVAYWQEIGGGDIVDLSQNTLRPSGGYSRIGSISIPQYQMVAPKAIDDLQFQGLYFPNPTSMAFYQED